MALLISYPDSISLSQNLKKIVASADNDTAFTLRKGEELIIDEIYSPDESGSIEIDLRDVVSELLTVQVPTSDSFLQKKVYADFTATLGDQSFSFRAIKGGVANSSVVASQWLQQNFLTWQPQQKTVTYNQPEWLSYYAITQHSIVCKLYNQDGTTTLHTLATVDAGTCISVNTQFSRIINLTDTKKLAYFDVWAQDATGVMTSYVQRYLLRNDTRQEKYFIFSNSVGGIDAVSFTGDCSTEAETEHELAQMAETAIQGSQVLHMWKKQSTGYKSAYEAKWLQDFFTSTQRYVSDEGALIEIIIQDSALTDSSSDFLKEFSFTYRHTENRPLLNLSRDKEIPKQITFPTAEQIFFLAPRLSDFQEAEVNPYLVIPVQLPYGDVWYRISVGSIKSYIADATQDAVTHASHFHDNKHILDQLKQDHVNAISLLQIGEDGSLVVKPKDDSTPRDMTTEGLFRAAGFRTHGAVPGMESGSGTVIDGGKIQADHLEVRRSMTVMDLIINQLQGVNSDFLFSDIGRIENVQQLESHTYVLTVGKKTDSDFTTLKEGDILQQIVNTVPYGGTSLYSSWMRVVSVNVAANTVTVVLYSNTDVPGGQNFAPAAGYNAVRRGNSVIPNTGEWNTRAQLWMLSAAEGRIQFLQNIYKPILEQYNYALSLGKLPDIDAIKKLPVTSNDIGLVAQTAIIEKLYQFDWNGDIVANKVDRGQWAANVACSGQPYRNIQYKSSDPTGNVYTLLEQHTVWHLGCRWGCLKDKTTLTPCWNSPDWIMLEGNAELEMRFESSEGTAFHAGHVDTLITPSVYMGNMDISSDIADIDWSWTFDRGTFAGRALHLTNDIMPVNWSRTNKAKFTCTAYVRIGENNIQPVSNNVII